MIYSGPIAADPSIISSQHGDHRATSQIDRPYTKCLCLGRDHCDSDGLRVDGIIYSEDGRAKYDETARVSCLAGWGGMGQDATNQ